VIGIDQHREADRLGPRAHVFGGVIERDTDDGEALVVELVLQGLPPGQVIAAASPGGEGDQQLLAAVPFLEPVCPTVEIRQRERRSVKLVERLVAALGVERDGGDSRFGVDHGQTSEGGGDRSNIEGIARKEHRSVSHRHAHLIAAEPLGFELPPDRGPQLLGRDEKAIARARTLDRPDVVADDRRLRHRPSSAAFYSGPVALCDIGEHLAA
jgi:hypothetical protein